MTGRVDRLSRDNITIEQRWQILDTSKYYIIPLYRICTIVNPCGNKD